MHVMQPQYYSTATTPRLRQAAIGAQVQGYGAAGRYLSLFLEISKGAAVN
jgi:hypothetical protein